jgi:hypothetical protein
MTMKTIVELGDFVRQWRTRVKLGGVLRAPLDLLRVEVRGGRAECDWLARVPDAWDLRLQRRRGGRLMTERVLHGGIDVSRLPFESLSEVHEAQFRAFRQSAREPPDLIITGKLRREAPAVLRVPSLAMRAKLHGFHFWLDDGVFIPLDGEHEQRGLPMLSNA